MNRKLASPADDHNDKLAPESQQREAQPGSPEKVAPNIEMLGPQHDNAVAPLDSISLEDIQTTALTWGLPRRHRDR